MSVYLKSQNSLRKGKRKVFLYEDNKNSERIYKVIKSQEKNNSVTDNILFWLKRIFLFRTLF
ncbi:hypothetical protein FM106_10335 [Brachybacterium faecium]|nr:hypothetical protein FM106_10335 [Brachybacterium faecium]